MEPWRDYLREYRRLNNRWANWRPDEDREIGAFGKVHDDQFIYLGTLQQIGIPFTVRNDRTTGGASFVSSAGASMTIKGKGVAPASAFGELARGEAGFKASFTKAGAVVMQCHSSRRSFISNVLEVRREILRRCANGTWNRDWWYIESLMRARTGIVILAHEAGAEVVVSANARVADSRANIGFEVRSTSGSVQQYPMNNGWVPEFEPKRLRYGLWQQLLEAFRGRPREVVSSQLTPEIASEALGTPSPLRLSEDMVDGLFTTRPLDPSEELDPRIVELSAEETERSEGPAAT